jgi:uncharacterized protein YbaR (Trm112 family)
MKPFTPHDEAAQADVSEGLLDLLVCPDCRKPLGKRGSTLLCSGCGRRYPVRDGVPVMLLDQTLPPNAASDAGQDGQDVTDRGESNSEEAAS